MRTLIAIALVTSVASAQDRRMATEGEEFVLRVRAADTTKQAVMTIAFFGRIYGSLGGVPGTYTEVKVGPSGGTGKGAVLGSLLRQPGRLTFESSAGDPELELTVARTAEAAKPILVARGRLVAVAYSSDGELSVGSKP